MRRRRKLWVIVLKRTGELAHPMEAPYEGQTRDEAIEEAPLYHQFAGVEGWDMVELTPDLEAQLIRSVDEAELWEIE